MSDDVKRVGKGGAYYEAQIPPTAPGDKELTIDLNTVPIHVDTISFEGIARTQYDYVQDAVSPLFKATTFADLILKVGEAQKRLRSLDAFSEVATMVDTSKATNATPNSYQVTFLVEEYKWVKGDMKIMAGSNDGTASFGLKAPNILGRGEKATLNYSYSNLAELNSEFKIVKPYPFHAHSNISSSLFYSKIPHLLSGFSNTSIGTNIIYSFTSKYLANCQIGWQGEWRQLIPSSSHTSLSVRESCGHSIKSALTLTCRSDKRDEMIFPKRGHLLTNSLQLAGLMGDAKFIKNEMQFQFNKSLFSGITIQSCLRGGFIEPLTSSRNSCNISDFFFLGGPQTLRGFEMRGVGPRSGINSTGGKGFWSGALHVYTPLPFTTNTKFNLHDTIRTHAFVNVGSLAHSFTRKELLDARVCFGVGLVVRMASFARVEVNYCWPWKYNKKVDRPHQGLQFGLGIDFL